MENNFTVGKARYVINRMRTIFYAKAKIPQS